jgi:hypothetical protein
MNKDELVDLLARLMDRYRNKRVWLKARQSRATKLENKIRYGVRASEIQKTIMLIGNIKKKVEEL